MESDLELDRKRHRRAWLSLADFMDAGTALNSYLTARSMYDGEGGANDLANTRYCLMGFAIVAYMRPFKRSRGDVDKATLSVTIEELELNLNADEKSFHERIETMRDKLFAHSDYSAKGVIAEGPNAARLLAVPMIVQVSSLNHNTFRSLVGRAVSCTTAYMERLHAKHGQQLLGE